MPNGVIKQIDSVAVSLAVRFLAAAIPLLWFGCEQQQYRSISLSLPSNIRDKQEDAAKDLSDLEKKVLWHLFGKNGINIVPAWAHSDGSKTSTIAIIDSGFLPSSSAFVGCSNHFFLMDFVGGYRQKGHHGAKVASLLGTCPNNPMGLIGVDNASPIIWLESGEKNRSPAANLMLWLIDEYDCSRRGALDCNSHLAKPIDVMNISGSLSAIKPSLELATHAELLTISGLARDKGTIIVAAAGNEGQNADHIFPHFLAGTISAGATTWSGVAADFSNWGRTVDIMAPGENVAVVANIPQFADGTSFSSPLVAGVVSLMKSVYPALNWKTAIYFMQSTAVPMDCDAYCVGRAACEADCCINGAQVCTPGRLDAGVAVRAAKMASMNGLPDIALVDSDKFFVELKAYGSSVAGKFKARNVGGRRGRYFLTTNNAKVRVAPNVIDLDRQGGPHDSQEVVISSSVSHPGWTNIEIKSKESGRQAGYTDEIVISAWQP